MNHENKNGKSLDCLDKDLTKNGFSKKGSETHITYARKLSENVSAIFRKIEEAKEKK
jgi:hypothetical protein